MEVQISKQVTETVSIDPGYYKGKYLSDTFYYINQSGVLVYIGGNMIWVITPDKKNYQNEVKEIVTSYMPCEQSEFEAAKDKALVHLKHYVSFPQTSTQVNPAVKDSVLNTMNITNDPAAKQPDELKNEQATEQIAAAESAAQDAAVGEETEDGAEAAEAEA